ncbi:MAG: transcription activator effector binding protein [uncultured bacterium]|nr:MAG: transcription activator effector binding protein [uncultured bacterium]
MDHTQTTGPEIQIVGIALRTDNSPPGLQKLGAHWQRFFAEKILEKIPNKASHEIYAVYTDYESDHTKAYTLILGAKVSESGMPIPQGLVAHTIPNQAYTVVTANGSMPQALIQCWQEIWQSDLKRKFTTDFELYDENSNSGEGSEVKIYLAV